MSLGKFKAGTEEMITAVHEAGHAVMAHLTNVPFEYVTIEPRDEDDFVGHVRLAVDGIARCDYLCFKVFHRGGFSPKGFGTSRDVLISAKIRDYIEPMMLIAAAGPSAEYLFTGEGLEELQEFGWLGTPDEQDFSEMGNAMTGSEEECFRFCEWMMVRAWNIMSVPAHQLVVETLANCLVERKTMLYAEVKGIIAEAFRDIRAGVVAEVELNMGVAV